MDFLYFVLCFLVWLGLVVLTLMAIAYIGGRQEAKLKPEFPTEFELSFMAWAYRLGRRQVERQDD